MGLAEKQWQPTTINHVILAWLRGEREAVIGNGPLAGLPEIILRRGLEAVLDNPNVDNEEENRARLRLIYIPRNMFMVEIPPDTTWFKVQNLTDNELNELHVVNFHNFNDPGDQNELAAVVSRKKIVEEKRNEKIELRAPPTSWEPPILWGHTKAGPFTIIEGNRRLIAYAASGQTGLDIPVFVGLSRIRCHWHLPDRAPVLMQDLIQRGP